MNWQEIVVDYLSFSRKDRIAIGCLLMLIAIITLFSMFSTKDATPQKTPDTAWVTAAKKLEEKNTGPGNSSYPTENINAFQYDPSGSNHKNNKPSAELFSFDPNTLSTAGWQKLGISDKTIRIIQNYLAKGGHFKKPDDLQKVYGLGKHNYERLSPYIKIEAFDAQVPTARDTYKKDGQENNPAFTKTSRYEPIDINLADTVAFISLPGIGNKLASRIVNFRDKLGGFYTIAQVRETFGLPDSTFQKIKQYLKLENIATRKININTATVDELKAHPYIRYALANPIIAYRNQHGSFSSIEDLKKIMVITDDVYNKITPYLTLGL